MDIARFRVLDRVRRLDAASLTIECEARVPAESTIFEGHFPGFEVLPGVLQVETIAQAAGLLLLHLEHEQRVPLLSGIDRVRFRSFVEPGSLLTVTARLIGRGSGYAVCSGQASSPRGLTASAEVRFRVMAFPSPLMRESVLAVARGLCRELAGEQYFGGDVA
jgi:3-hydroxyacyl-[acyl-carrier-protein] dehydratase